MLIGVDFDNTIVCYDEVFRKAAAERGLLPADGVLSKRALHDHLHQTGKVDEWTTLQGEVYGPLMRDAAPFPGVLDFFRQCRQNSIPLRIISHRTRFPYLGEQHDLHQAARDWLAEYGFHDPARVGLSTEHVFFEVSRADKLKRIASEGCTHFIDDLVEVLAEPEFPADVRRILFDPHGMHSDFTLARHSNSWMEMDRLL